MSQTPDTPQETNVSAVGDEASSLGEIKINHSVVASIVRLACLDVNGVVAVGGGFVDGIAKIFDRRESERGVRVEEDGSGEYHIEIRVVLQFGAELASVATQIQQSVSHQVRRMTSKGVARVDVIIDGVRTAEEAEREAWADARPRPE